MTVRKSCLLLTAFAALAGATSYTPLSEALKKALPLGQKTFKTTVVLTKDQAEKLNSYGRGDFLKDDEVDVYYTKDDHNQVTGTAVYLVEMLVRWKARHNWVIGLSPAGAITAVSVVELTDKYSFPLAGDAFLKQFPGKNPAAIEVGNGIDAVSGATESSKLMSASLKRAAYVVSIAGLK